jgi:hypothetical protein
VESQ